MKQNRISKQSTLAQVEIALDVANKIGKNYTMVRFDPKHVNLMTQYGIKFKQIKEQGYDDLYLVTYARKGD